MACLHLSWIYCTGQQHSVLRILSQQTHTWMTVLLFHSLFMTPTYLNAVAQWLRCCVTNLKVAGSIPAGVSEFFIDIKSFRSHYGPGSRLSLEQKWVPGVFHGDKGGQCVRLTTLPRSCAVVTKSGNLNFLEPSGPLRACNGTALPLTFICFKAIASSSGSSHLVPAKLHKRESDVRVTVHP